MLVTKDIRVEVKPDWQDYANCMGVDPDVFFPDSKTNQVTPMQICAECVVKLECLNYALEHGERYGVWGGTSERERRRILKARAAARFSITTD